MSMPPSISRAPATQPSDNVDIENCSDNPDLEASEVQKLYQRLVHPRSIRILVLDEGSATEPLSGTLLQAVDLDGSLKYESLSYRWSDVHPTDPTMIKINGVQFPIGLNLYTALIQFRQEQTKRYLWIDQVCINQDSMLDKIQQIKLMSDIYSKAEKVLVWLGTSGDQTDVAMEFFPIFVEQIRRNEETARLENSNQPPPLVIEWRGTLATILNRLFQHSWFGRVWTLQEVALAQKAEVWCGSKSFPFEVLEAFQNGCNNDKYGHWASALNLIETGADWKDDENPRRPLNAHIDITSALKREKTASVGILDSLRSIDCSEDQDRIYSVLRFLDSDLIEEIVGKEKSSIAELYHLVAAHQIKRGELDYVGAAGLSQHRITFASEQPSPKPCLSLPSWVPDWTYRTRTRSYWKHNRAHLSDKAEPLFTAGGPSSSNDDWYFSDDNQVLHATGLILDEVEACTEPFRVLQLPNDLGDQQSVFAIAQTGYREFQSYISACMELAVKCSPHYGSTNTSSACQQSILSGMILEGTTRTTTGTRVRVSNHAADTFFEDFQKMVSVIEELTSLQELMIRVQSGAAVEFTIEDQVRMMKAVSAAAEMKDGYKKHNLMQAMIDTCKARRFCITGSERFMGTAPDITEPGDKICVLQGCCAPFVIRPKGPRYQLIGECYVAGIMDGEMMEAKSGSLETISLE